MKKITAPLKYIFRKKLTISSDFSIVKIKDFQYSVSEKSITDYNNVVSISDKNIGSEHLHPVFFTKISWQIIRNLNEFSDKQIDADILKTIVHQSEHIIIHEQVENLTNLKVISKIIEINSHRKGTKFVIKFEYFAENTHIATEYSSGILFGVKLKSKGFASEKYPWPKKVDNKPVWTKNFKIDKDLPFEYAKKANIDAPIHTNHKFAKSLGLKGIILQGTCCLAKTINIIADKEYGGNTDKIKAFSARFTGNVFAPDEINIRLLEKINNTLYFDITNKKEKILLKGEIIVCK